MTSLPPGLLPRFLAQFGDSPAPWPTRAALLFADLSGFTALAERLSQRGAAGTEELSRLLNASFGPMVGQILDAGGDIVHFAGDAPIALFVPRPGEALGDAVRRAEACGHRLQTGLAAVAAMEAMTLTMRVTIAAGEMTARIIGGEHGRWEWFVGGEAFAQLAATQARTSPGQVTLTPEATLAREAVPAAAAGDELSIPQLASVGDDPSPAQVAGGLPTRGFVSRGLLARLDAGQDDLLAERRLVTVVFLRLIGANGEAEPAPETLAKAFVALQHAVYARGGSVNQFLRDDKGTVLVAAWGVPGSAHEDQAARAVDAARAALHAVERLGLGASAGVATGRVFCGWRGEARRREYALIGDVMNLAARLMTLEDNGVRCDEATAQALPDVLQTTAAAPVRLKGKAEPVNVFVPRRVSVTAIAIEPLEDLRPLVGRDVERAAIAAALSESGTKAGNAWVLRGEPGIGKTRLLQEAARLATGRVLRTAPSAIGAAEAYHAWRPVLEQLIGLPGRRGVREDRAARREAFDAWISPRTAAHEAAPLLRRLLHLSPTGRVSGALLSGRTTESTLDVASVGAGASDATRELLLALLREASADAPLLLLIDEAHALDSLSLRTAHEAALHVPGLTVLMATRPTVTGTNVNLDAILADTRITQLSLAPLDAAAVTEMVAQHLGVARVPAAVGRLVYERSGGNPLFAGELTASLHDEGRLLVSDGTCRLTLSESDLASHRFPDSVQGVVAGRFDRLDPTQQLALKAASVLGSEFSLETLERVHPVTASAAARRHDLELLAALGVLDALADGVDRYRFRSTVMQEVAYGLLPVAQRERMHAAAADFLEQSETRVWAEVAHHRMRSGEHLRAVESLEYAVEEAVSDGADREAARCCEYLLEYAADGRAGARPPVDVARWLRQAAHAHIRLGENRHGRVMIERALAQLGHRVPQSRAALAGRLVAEGLRQLTHLAFPGRWFTSRQRPGAQARLEAAIAAGHLPPLAFYEYDTLAYVTFCLVSVNLAEAAAAPRTAGEGYAALGFIAATAGLTGLSERWWGIGEREGDAFTRHNVMIARSLHLMARGALNDAEDCARRTVEQARAARDWTAYEKGLWMQFSVRQTRGDTRGTLPLAEALYASASGRDHRQHLLWAHIGLASFALESGDEATAARECDAAEALIAGADPSTRLVYRTGRLRHSVWIGDVERTTHDVRELTTLLGPSGDIPSSLSRTNLADARLLLWDAAPNDEARATARTEARRLLRQLRASLRYVPVYRSRAERFAGDVAWREGDADTARTAWSRAVAAASDIPLDAAQAHARLAQHATDAAARAVHASAVRDLLEPFGQRAYLARLTDLTP